MELLDIEEQKIRENAVNKPFTAILKSIRDNITKLLDLGVSYSDMAERLGYTIHYIKMLHNFINYKNIKNLKIEAQIILLEKFYNLLEKVQEEKQNKEIISSVLD